MSLVSFDEFSPGSNARMCLIQNEQYLSTRDVLMYTCGLNKKRANEKWERLPEDSKQELTAFCGQFRFPGPGNPTPVPVITFKGVLKLIMLVSGEKAAMHRTKMATILQRYYAGDGTLTDEVEANSQSDAPIAQMARASLISETVPVQNELSLSHKRKLEDLELRKLELEIGDSEVGYLVKCSNGYRNMCEDTVMDDLAKLIFKDLYLNMAMLQGRPGAMITNGEVAPNKPISLSLVAGEMGLKIPNKELISVGIELKKRYVLAHGKPPSKHDQLCDGRVTMVNSYSGSDRPLVEEVLRWHVANKAAPPV